MLDVPATRGLSSARRLAACPVGRTSQLHRLPPGGPPPRIPVTRSCPSAQRVCSRDERNQEGPPTRLGASGDALPPRGRFKKEMTRPRGRDRQNTQLHGLSPAALHERGRKGTVTGPRAASCPQGPSLHVPGPPHPDIQRGAGPNALHLTSPPRAARRHRRDSVLSTVTGTQQPLRQPVCWGAPHEIWKPPLQRGSGYTSATVLGI